MAHNTNEANVTSFHSLLVTLLNGFHDGGHKKSLLSGFLHRNDAATKSSCSSDQGPRVLENTLLAVAAAGAVLLLLLFPLLRWIRTRSFDAVIRFLSIPSLWTGLANGVIWMLYTSFVMKKDDCIELIIVYPMLISINFVYLIIIYGYKRSYVKALFLATVMFVAICYMFYIIRFEAKPPFKADFIASIGLLVLLFFNTFLLKDLVELNGGWERFAAFCNIFLSTLLNLMTFYVLIKKYPVQYFPILSSFMGIIWGLTEMLFLILRIFFRQNNGPAADESDDESSGDDDQDHEDENDDERSEDDDQDYEDENDDESDDESSLDDDQDHEDENDDERSEDDDQDYEDENDDESDDEHNVNQPAAVLPYVAIDIPDENIAGSEAEPAHGSVPSEEELKRSAEASSNQNPVIIAQARSHVLVPVSHQEIVMPSLSPTMTEGNIAKWVKKEGDKVSPGEVLREVQTDTATVEMECMEDGYLANIVQSDGTKYVKVGEIICVTVEEERGIEKFKDYKPSPSNAAVAPPESKAKSEPAKPMVVEKAPARTLQPKAPITEDASRSGDRIFSSPLARKLAEDNNAALSSAQGTSPDGPVLKADIDDYIVAVSETFEPKAPMTKEASLSGEITEQQAVNRASEGVNGSGKASVCLEVLPGEARKLRAKEKKTKKPDVRSPSQVKPVRKKPWTWRPGICCQVDV